MSRNKEADKRLGEFMRTLLGIKSEKEMLDFLQGILTPGELEEIPMRLQIVKMLKKGEGQHEIAAKLRVGVATVSRGVREIKMGRFKKIE